MTKLSDTALVLLGKAAQNDDRFAEPPKHLPAAARNAVVRSLLKQGLLIEDAVPLNHPMTWRTDDSDADGGGAELRCSIALRITDAGFRAIGQEPPTMTEAAIEHELDLLQEQIDAENAADDAGTVRHAATNDAVAREAAAVADDLDAAKVAPTPRNNLRTAAAAVLAAWDDQDNRDTDSIAALEAPMEALRILLAGSAPREATAPRKPREGTKQKMVLTLLRRTEGATIAQIIEATGWQQHTVRGFLAGLKKKGINVETLERVRMVGPNKEGAKGSYSVYSIKD